jgi:hypothetical protein
MQKRDYYAGQTRRPGHRPARGGQLVIVGSHLDSWIFGTGAPDNDAGSMVATPTALLIGKGVRDILPHSLGYWNDSAKKSAGNGNACG